METNLTVEKKAELFDKIMEQRQHVVHNLYDLLDAVNHLENNFFGLGKEECEKLKSSTHYKLFKMNCDRIVADMDGYKRAELLELSCEKWPIEKVDRPYWMEPGMDVKKTKRWIVQKLMMFFNDFQIGRSGYPGADIGVYEEYASSLMYSALSSIGVEHTDSAIIRFMNEVLPEDGKVLDEDERENWQCKSSVLLNDLIQTFHEFLHSEPSPENVKKFSDRFSEICRLGESMNVIDTDGVMVYKSPFSLPSLKPLPVEYGVKIDALPEESDKDGTMMVAIRVNRDIPESANVADYDKEVLDWGNASGITVVDSSVDGKTNRKTWLFKCRLEKIV